MLMFFGSFCLREAKESPTISPAPRPPSRNLESVTGPGRKTLVRERMPPVKLGGRGIGKLRAHLMH